MTKRVNLVDVFGPVFFFAPLEEECFEESDGTLAIAVGDVADGGVIFAKGFGDDDEGVVVGGFGLGGGGGFLEPDDIAFLLAIGFGSFGDGFGEGAEFGGVRSERLVLWRVPEGSREVMVSVSALKRTREWVWLLRVKVIGLRIKG